MFDKSQSEWLQLFSHPEPSVRLQHRLLLLQNGSEFSERRVYDPRRLAVASDLAETVLLGAKPTAAEITAGSRVIQIPSSQVAIIEELNYFYRESSDGALTSDINGCTLELQVGSETTARLPKFTLDAYHRGATGLLFGTYPLGLILQPGKLPTLKFKGNGGGGDSMDVRVSVTVRFEPKWLMQAAGLILQNS